MSGRGVAALAADLIRPACDLCVGNVHVVAEQLVDAGLGRVGQPVFGDEADDLVSTGKRTEGGLAATSSATGWWAWFERPMSFALRWRGACRRFKRSFPPRHDPNGWDHPPR